MKDFRVDSFRFVNQICVWARLINKEFAEK